MARNGKSPLGTVRIRSGLQIILGGPMVAWISELNCHERASGVVPERGAQRTITYGGGVGPDAPGGGADPDPVPGRFFRRLRSMAAATMPAMTTTAIPANKAYASIGGRPRIVEGPDPLEPEVGVKAIDSGTK